MGPIAVFDSGVGGLSVLRELVAQMPSEHFLYFGDSANAPYGTRPTAEIRSLTLAHAERLFDRGAKALVVACNTATSAAIGELRARWPDRVIIGIEPALKLAVSRHPGVVGGGFADEHDWKFSRRLVSDEIGDAFLQHYDDTIHRLTLHVIDGGGKRAFRTVTHGLDSD